MNPKLQYCRCGYAWLPKWYHKVLMLLFGEYVWTCPKCQSRITFILMNHVVKADTVKVLDERIWDNG